MPGNLGSMLTVQQRIAELAQRSPDFGFFSLAHYIDLNCLLEAYDRTRKDGSAVIDEVSGKEYAENLCENLQSLLNRLKSGTYIVPFNKCHALRCFTQARRLRSHVNVPNTQKATCERLGTVI